MQFHASSCYSFSLTQDCWTAGFINRLAEYTTGWLPDRPVNTYTHWLIKWSTYYRRVCFPGVTTHCGCIFHNPVAGFSLLVCRGFLIIHNDAPQSVGLLWTSDQSIQRPLPDNTQHSQQTNIHAPGGIRTHDLSRRAAENLRLRRHGHGGGVTVPNMLTINKVIKS